MTMFENTFSRRKGYTPPPIQGKRKELSAHTRNRLWDIFYIGIYRANQFDDITGGLALLPTVKGFFRRVWTELYHRRIDEYPGAEHFLRTLRDDFLAGIWH